MNALKEPEPAGSGAPARPPLVRELLLVAGLFLVYKLGRRVATGHTGEAYRNGHGVWDLERALHLPGEGAVQSLLLHGDGLAHLANTYYAVVHFPATAAFLVWLYLRRPAHYVWARRTLAAVGLVVATRAWWRWLWLLHPLVTLLVIVGTANHFWLDALVAAALLGLALVVLRLPRHTAAGAGRIRARHVPVRDRALAGAGR